MLVWATADLPKTTALRLEGASNTSITGKQPELLLDGQQRMTSLAAIIKGRPLYVRWKSKPIDIVFNVKTEQFDVGIPRHRNDPNWISLTRLFTHGTMKIMQEQFSDYGFGPEGAQIMDRLTRIDKIRDQTYRVNRLTDLDYEEVTRIFVRINSGGTRLSSADLTLAQLSSRWTGITLEFEEYQKHLKRDFGIDIDNNILVRTLSSLFSGQSRSAYMFRANRSKATIEDIKPFWERLKPAMDQAIIFLRNNCKIDRLNMLPTQAILTPLTQYFDRFGKNMSQRDNRMLQRWVYLALIWSRYSFSPESSIDQDVNALNTDDPIMALNQNIYDRFGQRQIDERQLRDQLSNSPFMLMCYVLARMNDAQDWFSGTVIGDKNQLEYHHIFPKSMLAAKYDLKKDVRIVDQVANLAFISSSLNKTLSNTPPAQYMPSIDPIRLQAQNVPRDPALWNNFEDFMLARRTQIADAINKLLDSLTDKPSLWPTSDIHSIQTRVTALEHTLRDLVATRLTESLGANVWEQAVPAQIRSSIESRIKKRETDNPYEKGTYETLESKLGMCQFSDYIRIMQHGNNWSLFSDIFGNLDKLNQHMSAVINVRNAVAHNNSLPKTALLNGEAGLIWIEECLQRLPKDDADMDAEDEAEDEEIGIS